MYLPNHFKIQNFEKILNFLKNNNFGTIYSCFENVHSASHLPFLIESREDKIFLSSHFAKANPHWKNLNGRDALIVFLGPHVYISPEWYEEEKSVPTWNYVAVHLTGKITLIENELDLGGILQKLVLEHERSDSSWIYNPKSDFSKGLHKAIIGFTIEVNDIQAKWKLSQNHTLERKNKVISKLQEKTDDNSRAIAQFMKDEIKYEGGI
jgi:transcriptional regulator